jgi:hypothetical protein
MWILDDLSGLRQINAQTATTAAVLFKPREAVRARIGGGRGFGGGGGGGAAAPTSGQAQCGPNGASIEYYLARAQSGGGPIAISILDSANHEVRKYSSEASAAAVADAPAAAPDDEEGGGIPSPPPVRLTTNAG